MLSSPKISICSSAARPKDWEAFYNSVRKTTVPYEIVFAGPNPPISQLPPNFRFIHTPVKICQCYHISYMQAQSDIIISSSDDVEFGEGAIDAIYDFMMQRKDEKLLISGFEQFEDEKNTTQIHIMHIESKEFLFSPFPVFWKNTYIELGGYDNRFCTGQMENDFILRVISKGGRVEICRKAVLNVFHTKKHNNQSITKEIFKGDRSVLSEIWFKEDSYNFRNGNATSEPKLELQPFEDTDILTKSQGISYHWA